MFNLFSHKPTDVKGVRHAVLQFIKEELKKNEGGEGGNIKSILLYVHPKSSEAHIYRSALFADDTEKFKKEVQRIADDFDVALPANWKLEVYFDEEEKSGATRSKDVDVALNIITNLTVVEKKNVRATVHSLNGPTEKEEYLISSTEGRINIGREIQAQTTEGFFRKNYIAFIDPDIHVVNRSVSRQHAHIEWNEEFSAFYLFADEGGIPPHNKMKVRGVDGSTDKVQTTILGHRLKSGDQIILGDGAVLEFNYYKE